MHRFATLEGRVQGYLGTQYTNGFDVALVLTVQAMRRQGRVGVWEITTLGLGALQQERPDIHAVIVASLGKLQGLATDQWGDFRLDGVPVGNWAYMIRAYDGTRQFLGQHTDIMGRDGRGGRDVVHGHDLGVEGKRAGIIVPVYDRWYCPPPPCSTDPPTDPRHVMWGMRMS